MEWKDVASLATEEAEVGIQRDNNWVGELADEGRGFEAETD
jgi:hypothetical protein